MCWSGEASAVLAGIGALSTIYFAHKKEPLPLVIALGYFTLMELLQAFTYMVIDNCNSPSNQIATLLGFYHIIFQPFFINMVSLHFVRFHISDYLKVAIYCCCAAGALMILIQGYPFAWTEQCTKGILCGQKLCSYSGKWHIAWDVPITNIVSSWLENLPNWAKIEMFGYLIPAFILPLVYGSWKITFYHCLFPFAASLTTNNPNEVAAIWCLLSIGLMLIMVKTPIRKLIYVDSWYGIKIKKASITST